MIHCFALGRWHIADRFHQSPVIEPVDPLQRGVFPEKRHVELLRFRSVRASMSNTVERVPARQSRTSEKRAVCKDAPRMIIDAIQFADPEYIVYFVLMAYVEVRLHAGCLGRAEGTRRNDVDGSQRNHAS